MSQNYAFMVEVNDLTASVVWANIPDANVPASAVTQHVAVIDHDSLLNFTSTEHFTQAAISIPLSQINDVTATAAEVNLLDIASRTAGDILSADNATTVSWKAPTQVIVTSTTTALADITDAINTGAAKVAGYQVFNTTTNTPVWAVGDTDGAVWVDGVGTTAHTPV